MDNTEESPTCISLCSGYGGLEIGIERALGRRVNTLTYVEIEDYSIKNLVSKMENGLISPCPIWTNLKTFPCEAFRGRVDILTGGYPCQPFSAAGNGLGKDDPRHLWPYITEIIRGVSPRVVFFENVEGHINRGLEEVLQDLEELGYQATWGIFSASEAGAPHQRKRVFILGRRA